MENVVQIPLSRWEDIQDQLEWLDCLEAAGVDNWEGYDIALEMLREDRE